MNLNISLEKNACWKPFTGRQMQKAGGKASKIQESWIGLRQGSGGVHVAEEMK